MVDEAVKTPTEEEVEAVAPSPKPKAKVKAKKQGKPRKTSNKAVSETIHGANGQGEYVLPKPGEDYTLDNGVVVRFDRISLALTREAQSAIPDPDTKQYMFDDPNTGLKVFNADHPEYKVAVKATETEREQAGMDIMIAMGFELVNPMPVGDEWTSIEKRLRWLDKKGRIDLSGLDLSDELDREFAYKKYILASLRVFYILNSLNGYSLEGIARQAQSFQDDEKRDSD